MLCGRKAWTPPERTAKCRSAHQMPGPSGHPAGLAPGKTLVSLLFYKVFPLLRKGALDHPGRATNRFANLYAESRCFRGGARALGFEGPPRPPRGATATQHISSPDCLYIGQSVIPA